MQFLPDCDKDEQWVMDNVDWLEWEGIRQIKWTAPRLLKNCRMAEGVIDNEDYGISETNEYSDAMDVLAQGAPVPTELKFFPIAPIISDIFQAELSRRPTKLSYYCKDNYSFNELQAQKRQMIEETLMADTMAKRREALYAAGFEGDEQQWQQELSPEKLRTLPEIEQFFKKDYKSIYEIWANKQQAADEKRFYMKEIELQCFKDSYVMDREFWHYRMLEDDYDIERWNPPQVFYRKSPGNRYMSNASSIGMIDWYTMPDVVDKFGWLMNAEQLESLNYFQPATNVNYTDTNQQNDGSYYDPGKSHAWNTTGPSLQMRQFESTLQMYGGLDNWLASDTDQDGIIGPQELIRVTTVYWKTVRRFFNLTRITENGEMINTIVSDNYKVTEKAMYDTTYMKEKTKENLIYGEHLETLWAPEVWGAIKIGPNRPHTYTSSTLFEPIYVGINQNKPGRLKFQFKGDNSIWGCKLPVEGRMFTDRNTRSSSLIDRIAPDQVNFNMVNNQITDILIDEIGPVIMFDENAIPKHSLGEDWDGEQKYFNMHVGMKKFQMMPMNTARYNTEVPINFTNYQKLDMEQSQRFLSRIQLAEHFWNSAMRAIGMTPERLGQMMSKRDTATGVENSVNASYTQTEMYFIRHSEELMPRVHQMRTELAQYYHSTNPSVRLQYILSNEERTAFQVDGTKLPLIDLGIQCVSDSMSRQFLKDMKDLVIRNNTTNADMDDLFRMMGAQTPIELEIASKTFEERRERIRQEELQMQQQQFDAEQKLRLEQEDRARQFEAQQAEMDRQKDILVAQIKAASANLDDSEGVDYDNYRREMDAIQQSAEYQELMNFNREKEINKNNIERQKMDIKREELNTRQQIARDQIAVAKINKNKYDKSTPRKKK